MLLREKTSLWVARFDEKQIPCSAIRTVDQVFEDPHIEARGGLVHHVGPQGQSLRTVATPLHFTYAACGSDLPPPQLGQHSAAVLKDVLGMSDHQLEALMGAGIIT